MNTNSLLCLACGCRGIGDLLPGKFCECTPEKVRFAKEVFDKTGKELWRIPFAEDNQAIGRVRAVLSNGYVIETKEGEFYRTVGFKRTRPAS